MDIEEESARCRFHISFAYFSLLFLSGKLQFCEDKLLCGSHFVVLGVFLPLLVFFTSLIKQFLVGFALVEKIVVLSVGVLHFHLGFMNSLEDFRLSFELLRDFLSEASSKVFSSFEVVVGLGQGHSNLLDFIGFLAWPLFFLDGISAVPLSL